MTIHESIGKEIQTFGGVLRCTVCGSETPLGDIGANLKNGWPKCHDLTMRWLTDKELRVLATGSM